MSIPTPGTNVRERIKKRIYYDLGRPVIKVEVPEEWVDDAIDIAIQEFSRFSPLAEKWTVFQTQAGVTRYQVPDDYLFIRSVIYHPNFSIYGYYNIYNLFGAWGPWMDWFRNLSLTDYVITDVYIEMSRRSLGLEGTWYFDHPYLYIFPKPRENIPVFVKYSTHLTVDNISKDVREETWIRKYALAMVKIRLGRVRSKFSSVPGPRGDLTLDGAALIEEAKSEIERLEDVLRTEYEEPLGFYTDASIMN